MEPPGEGRYEISVVPASSSTLRPQWSRPVKGGTRARGIWAG